MKKKNRLILILVFIPAIIFSQRTVSKKTLSIAFSPAICLTPNEEFGLQPGIEYKISDHLSFLTDFAFVIRKKFTDSSILNRRYFRIKPEIRYLFPKNFKNVIFYFGLQCSYSFRKFDDLNGGYIVPKTDSAFSYDAATINSPMFTSAIQMGYKIFFSKRFSVESFQGFGVRLINTTYKNVANPIPQAYYQFGSPDRIGPLPAYVYNGTITRFQYNIGIRLAYYIK